MDRRNLAGKVNQAEQVKPTGPVGQGNRTEQVKPMEPVRQGNRTGKADPAEKGKPVKRRSGCRFVVIALACILLLACGGCVPAGEEQELEELVIRVYDPASDYVGEQGGWYGRILAEKFRIRLDFLDTAEGDALQEADLIIYHRTDKDGGTETKDLIKNLIEEKRLLNMEPYLEEREIWEYEGQLRYWNQQLAEEGIYVIPTRISRMAVETPSEEEVPLYGIYLRWEDYARAGYPRIRDRQELLEVLADMKSCSDGTHSESEGAVAGALGEDSGKSGTEGYKTGEDSVPEHKAGVALYREPGDDILEQLARMVGAYGYETLGFAMYRQNSLMDVGILDEDILLIRENPLMEAVHWLWEANQAGLLDKESRTQDREAVLGKYERGLVLAYAEPSLGMEGYELGPVEDMEAVSHGCDPKGTLDTFVAVNSSAGDPDRILDLVSWLYSAEGIMDSGTHTAGKTAGPLGLTWEVSEGVPVLTEFGTAVTGGKDQKLPEGWGEGTWEEGRCRLSLQPVTAVEASPSGFLYNYTLWESVVRREDAVYQDWRVKMEAGDAMEYLMKNGNLAVIPSYVEPEGGEYEDTEEIRQLRQALKPMIEESLWDILEAPDEESYERLWNEMVQEAEQMGYEKVLNFDLEKVDRLRDAREEAAR